MELRVVRSEAIIQTWKLIAAQIRQIDECLQLAGSVLEDPCLDPVWGRDYWTRKME